MSVHVGRQVSRNIYFFNSNNILFYQTYRWKRYYNEDLLRVLRLKIDHLLFSLIPRCYPYLQVRLEYPDEFLTSVDGYYGSLQEWGPILILSLTFHSNRTTYGPFGVEQGTYFTCPKMNAKIVGFLGKSGWYLDAIGVYVEPLHKPIASNSIYSQQYITHNTEYSMIHGSLGTNYDLIVAVKQKDVQNTSPAFNLSPQISHDFTKQPKIHEVSCNV